MCNKIGNLDDLYKDLSEVFDNYKKNKTLKRNEITLMFNKHKYYLGINPKTKENIYASNKALSYIIYKHGNQINKTDILSLGKITECEFIYQNVKLTQRGNNGYIYYKKSSNTFGWLEYATKIINGNEELIHFVYLKKSSYEKKIKKIGEKIIDKNK